MRKTLKRRVIMERLTPVSGVPDDFDLTFWQRAGSAARFSAAWKMLEDFYKIRRINGYKLRLQRFVQSIKQT